MFTQFHQFYRFACQRTELGLNCKEDGAKREKSKDEGQTHERRTNEEIPARNVVGHDILRVPRNYSEAARARREGTDNVVLHDIVCVIRHFSEMTETSEQCRATRHLIRNPHCTTFFGRNTQRGEHCRATRHL